MTRTRRMNADEVERILERYGFELSLDAELPLQSHVLILPAKDVLDSCP